MSENQNLVRILPFIAWPIIASAFSFLFGLGVLSSTLVFLATPALGLSFILPKMVKKIALFSATTTIPFVIVVDYIAHLTGQWLVLGNVFPRLLGLVAVEDIIWGFLFVYLVLMFYEYFVESRKNTAVWHPRMNWFIGALWALLGIFLTCYFLFPRVLDVHYFYFWAGLSFMAVPSIAELFRRPRLLPKFLMTASYFFFFAFVYEITALKLGQWTFPSSQYLGWVSILGVQFPFEELFFGFIFYSMVALSYYESFDDDEK